ncbi:MAG: carbohydrate ABC transporter permease [Clostridiales bacterium]|uniref:carbohydrate ABC transporter permease n=1 Tax=Provencibacterium massiliense TaxID=1841868 RepID=UPI0009A7EDF1|nr:carbohydrate ABC transporter permease [Provencibacterium massiliense]PWM39345.1 MAG: carbohydrate ABC transporter permease [Clostridiales bacterium]RGB65301.1 carbohydrate ABC transporter permease [Harryflintia acetispora]
MNKKLKHVLKRTGLYALVLLIVVYVLAPYLWMVISSISTKVDLMEVPLKFIPRHPTLQNYKDMLLGTSNSTTDAASQFMYAMKNSAIVTVCVTAVSMAVGILASYAFSRFRFRFKQQTFMAILFTQMIPPIAIIIPLYMIMLRAKLLDNIWALTVVYLSFVLPFVIWIMKGYIDGIPTELEESAMIDGCGRLRSFFLIVLPVASTGLAATTIFAFIISWNEFFYALNFTSLAAKTLPVLITEFSSKYGADYILTCTSGVIASLPPVLLALIFQKYIIAGLTSGAVKG